MTIRFNTALLKMGRATGSADFTMTKYASYLTDSSRILEDAEMLSEWSTEIVKFAKLSVVAGEVDLAGLILVENLAAEFDDALAEAVDLYREYTDDEIDDEFEDDFEEFSPDEVLDIIKDEIDRLLSAGLSPAEEQSIIDDEFDGLIDANFTDEEIFTAFPDDEDCGCAECTAAADFEDMNADELTVVAASVHDLVKESFLTMNGKYRHPALRDDSTPEAYATKWKDSFLAAAAEGPYQLAKIVASLSELCDDTMYALIAKNAPSIDSYAQASKSCINRAGSLLAVI